MSRDITSVLREWKFDAEQFQTRLISGDDGKSKIQMRVELGILQMELAGRPDGMRPEGFESLLEFHEDCAERAAADNAPFSLDSDSCASLMREGLQYYQRYLSAFHLELYEIVTRDTERNLRLFAFVSRHARQQRDKLKFEQYRPYVLMMRTRARASQVLRNGDRKGALAHIDDGIKSIRHFLQEYHQENQEVKCFELGFLVRWRGEIDRESPTGPLELLEQQLEMSVALENYEEAARLRDQIRRLERSEPQ